MSFLKHRPHRKTIRSWWSGLGPRTSLSSSATTDDIPSLAAYEHIRNLPRRPSDPTNTSTRPRSLSTLRSVLTASYGSSETIMACRATITFTQPGVQPPVYVVTSLSDPPWEPLELAVSEEKTDAGHHIFTRQFDHVAEGNYQYKIRIGEGHWVVDEYKDSATDGSGNRNNVILVEAAAESPQASPAPAVSTPDLQDSTQHVDTASEQTSSSPTPFVVEDKVSDEVQPTYGDVEPETLDMNATKRTADAEPDFETIQPETPLESTPQDSNSHPVPVVVVEKVDDVPSHGDDFGKNATSAQKLAHEIRSADASPNKVIVTPEPENKPVESPTEGDSVQANTPETEGSDAESKEEAVPLFGHESIEPKPKVPENQDLPLLRHETSQDEVQASVNSNNSTSAKPVPEPHQKQDSPLFRHESFLPGTSGRTPANTIPTIDVIEEESVRSSTDQESSHAGADTPSEFSENQAEDNEVDKGGVGELNHGPLLSHETGFANGKSLGELDDGPLMSHETEFSSHDTSEDDKIMVSESDLAVDDNGLDYEDEDDSEGASPFSHEAVDGDEDESPLLPHERGSKEPSHDGSEVSGMADGEQTFPYEHASATETYGHAPSLHLFANRTNTSGLPHRMARSDENDDDLKDPLLEDFPIQREQILERVRSIGSLLPADETRERDFSRSPDLSVKSQACSSTDLKPITSHSSLRPVAEESILETNSDPEPSAADEPLSMETQWKKPSEAKEADGQGLQRSSESMDASRSVSSSEPDSVEKNDGANDSPETWNEVVNSIATPANVLNPPTPPLTPERETGDSTETSRDTEATPKESQDTEIELLKSSSDGSAFPPGSCDAESDKQNWFRSFVHFLTACLKDQKQASGAVLVAGSAVAAYYLLSGAKG